MSSIIIQANPKSGIKYAYESFSYWDKEKKAPRTTRKYLGRVDEETGEIIPKKTRRKNTSLKGVDPASAGIPLENDIENRDKIIEKLKRENETLYARIADLESVIKDITRLCGKVTENT